MPQDVRAAGCIDPTDDVVDAAERNGKHRLDDRERICNLRHRGEMT